MPHSPSDRAPSTFPTFLQSPESFATHLGDEFLEESNQVKGEAFLRFAMNLMPLCDLWDGFNTPQPSAKRSHDKGVDFWAQSEDGRRWIAGQSKYRIREVGELDTIISKFHDFERQDGLRQVSASSQLSLLVDSAESIRFVIVTSSVLANIVERYRKSRMASRDYFDTLERTDRIEIIDGTRLLRELQVLYQKNYILAPRIVLPLSQPYLRSGNVYLSIVTGETLAQLYTEHGSSLFFENIREFLGAGGDLDSESVNADIMRTLTEEPARMLGRNNGITLKADKVTPDGQRLLILEQSSIVNGCQTTMCIVHARAEAHKAEIVAKIVEGGDSWDIAKAANNQNRVSRIDLELARFLRPQLIRKVATDMGFGLPLAQEKQTVSNVLESIHRNRVSYESIRLLYLGIFSRSPSNMWQSNYSEVRRDVLERFHNNGHEEELLRTLFRLLAQLRDAMHAVQSRHQDESYTALFKRFFDERRPKYQCFLAILSACGCVHDSLIRKAPEAEVEYERLQGFLSRLSVVLQKAPDVFEEVLQESFAVVADRLLDSVGPDEGESAIAQRMFNETEAMASSKKFERTVSKLRVRMNNRPGLMDRLPTVD